MSTGRANALLLVVCAGSLAASGAQTLYVRHLSTELRQWHEAVARTQPDAAAAMRRTSNAGYGASPAAVLAADAQQAQLREEIASLRHAVETVQSIMAANVQADQPPNIETAAQREQQQQRATQLVTDALSSGYWSRDDAGAFRSAAVGLPPAVVERMASSVIRAMEDGTVQMDGDLLMPF